MQKKLPQKLGSSLFNVETKPHNNCINVEKPTLRSVFPAIQASYLNTMKLIEHINFTSDVDTAALLLKDHGILATSTNENVSIPTYSIAARNIKKGVWIHLDHQYDDAVNLLKDETYKVQTGLTKNEMAQLSSASKVHFNKLANYFILIAAGLIVIMLCLAFYFLPTLQA